MSRSKINGNFEANLGQRLKNVKIQSRYNQALRHADMLRPELIRKVKEAEHSRDYGIQVYGEFLPDGTVAKPEDLLDGKIDIHGRRWQVNDSGPTYGTVRAIDATAFSDRIKEELEYRRAIRVIMSFFLVGGDDLVDQILGDWVLGDMDSKKCTPTMIDNLIPGSFAHAEAMFEFEKIIKKTKIAAKDLGAFEKIFASVQATNRISGKTPIRDIEGIRGSSGGVRSVMAAEGVGSGAGGEPFAGE